MKNVIEMLKDIFVGNGEEEETTEVNEEFTFVNCLMSAAALIATLAPLGAILFIFG